VLAQKFEFLEAGMPKLFFRHKITKFTKLPSGVANLQVTQASLNLFRDAGSPILALVSVSVLVLGVGLRNRKHGDGFARRAVQGRHGNGQPESDAYKMNKVTPFLGGLTEFSTGLTHFTTALSHFSTKLD
jgi:hypothetical protein